MTTTSTEPDNNGGNPLTMEQIMQHIEELRRENDAICTQSEGEHTQWRAESERR